MACHRRGRQRQAQRGDAVISVPPSGDGAGYASRAYARSLAAEADVVSLPGAGGYLVVREIEPGMRDLASAYPMFGCRNWAGLRADVGALAGRFVSATIATDPFAAVERKDLEEAFDVVRPLHQHFIVELGNGTAQIGRHHRRKLRAAAAAGNCRIEIAPPDAAFLEHWLRLYRTLIERKHITDMRTFSRAIFAQQIAVPGAVIASAWAGGELLGADWYFRDGENVYAHLSAYSAAGYARAVSYPLMRAAIEHFQPLGTRLTLGGVPAGQEEGGLAHFKAGWASCTLPTYICGAVLMEGEFRRLNRGLSPTAEGYFPRYRQGEFRPGN